MSGRNNFFLQRLSNKMVKWQLSIAPNNSFPLLIWTILIISFLVPLQGGLKILKTNLLFYHLIRGFLVFFGNFDLPFIASSGTIMTIFYLIFALAIPFFLYNEAMRYIEVGMASLVLVLIIPFGFLFATIFLGEDINMIKSIGAIIVMFGVVLPQISDYFIKGNKLSEEENS